MCHKAYIPKTIAELILDTVEFPPKTFHMSHMSYMDTTYHAEEYIIYAIQNTEPARPLVQLGHVDK